MKNIMYHGMELLPIKSDIVFKVLFGKMENRDILAGFLSAILDLDIGSPESLELTNTEMSPEYDEDKMSRFDVRVKLRNGVSVEIEIQLQNEGDMIARSLYYHGKLFVDQMVNGMEYSSLRRAITLNIVDFDLLPEEGWLNRYYYKHEKSGQVLSELCEINFLELGKVPKRWYNEAEMWSLFIATENEEVIDMLAHENKGIGKAVEKLKYISADEQERYRISQIEKSKMDYESRMKSRYRRGKAEGIKEGIEQGIEKGAKERELEIVRKMIPQFDDESISDVTGVDVSVVARLRQESCDD